MNMPIDTARTVKEMWKRLSKSIIPTNTPILQRRGMEYAFYAGSYAMFQAVKIIGELDIKEVDAIVFLELLDHELETYFKKMKEW